MLPHIRNLADYQQIRQSFLGQCPEHFNFAADVFDRWAKEQPDNAALHWVGAESERTVTFRDMSRRSRQIAAVLLNLGLKGGDRVLVVLPRVIEWWEALLGLCRANLVAMPGTVMLTTDDIVYRVSASGAVAVITDVTGAEKIDSCRHRMPSLHTRILVDEKPRVGWHSFADLVDTVSASQPPVETPSDDPALIYFTSGTTGPPKMVLHTHASYGFAHQTTGRYWLDLEPDDLHWNISDTGWAKAAWSSFFGPWHTGACVFAVHDTGKFHPSEVLNRLSDYPITSLCAPPTIYRMLVQEDLAGFNPKNLRSCVAAGEPLNPDVIAAWQKATGLTIRDGYGQTETVLLCANFPGIAVKPGSMGLPAPGFDLAVVDDAGDPSCPGTEGDLAIRIEPQRPVGLFREYYRDREAAARSIRNGWYATGDRGYVDEDGYFWFAGRADDVITSSAYRIGPFEVESALAEHPAVVEAAVVGMPDPVRSEIVKAFVVLADGYDGGEQLKRELQEHVKQKTAPYKYPREIEFLDELPKTISGKIRRVELRKPAEVYFRENANDTIPEK